MRQQVISGIMPRIWLLTTKLLTCKKILNRRVFFVVISKVFLLSLNSIQYLSYKFVIEMYFAEKMRLFLGTSYM